MFCAPLHTYGVHEGAPLAPAPITVQLPAGAAHVSHAPAHALSQQYPSTQWFELHSLSCAHSAPIGLRP